MNTPPTDSLSLALWQTPLPVPGDGIQPGLRALDAALAEAAALGAYWLVTPEMALTGYAIGSDRARALAQAADGPLAEAVAQLAQRHGVGIVYGFPEHNGDALPFNSVQAIHARGERLGLYRKTHLYGAVDTAQFSPGDSLPPVIDVDGWRIGLLICYDIEFPEPARDLALRGADVLLVPTANMVEFPEVVQRLVPARACENRLFVAYVNACGTEPLAGGSLRYGGLSTLCGPMGEVLSQAGDAPALWVHTLRRGELLAARQSSQLPQRRAALYASLSEREDQKLA